MKDIEKIRNIGISAHIDSGKTTLTERMLFYAGRIHRMQEVHDNDGGATMDYTDIEQERGITITSAATQVSWNSNVVNVIDTPGHVDFTVEVERSLRVLDGAVMVLCSVGGVQSQSVTVDRQMKRYRVPRIAFINKMDRPGADADRVVREMREKLDLNPVPVQICMGAGGDFEGVIDLVDMAALTFAGEYGQEVVRSPIPAAYADDAEQAREAMLEALSMHDDRIMELFVEENEIPRDLVQRTLRSATINREVVPVAMGSALNNKGVQPLMDMVCRYLPSPLDRQEFARDHRNDGAETPLCCDPASPMVGMVFKIIDESFGQLNYIRIYQGRIEQGASYVNSRTGDTVRAGRILKIHADEREKVDDAGPGDIVALIGADCVSGDTLCDREVNLSMESIRVAEPVISLSVVPASNRDQDKMAKALNRFMKEDPTFRVSSDTDTGALLIAGMGELHLDVYIERMRREYGAAFTTGAPHVSYREAPTRDATFDYRHRKQTGGRGEYAHVVGRMEPLAAADGEETYLFEDNIKGGRIPREYIPAVNRGFQEAMNEGPLAGYPIVGCKMSLNDGSFHDVDSSEKAFHTCALHAFRAAFGKSAPELREPVMAVTIESPAEFQGSLAGDLNSRRGTVRQVENLENHVVITADVPLAEMFGYATTIRSLSKGMATFSMEASHYAAVPVRIAEKIIKKKQAVTAGS